MDDGRRVEVVQVRCSPAEKQAWQEAAARGGVSVSELVRLALNSCGLGAGAAGDVTAADGSGDVVAAPAPAPSPRPFRPDPKGK